MGDVSGANTAERDRKRGAISDLPMFGAPTVRTAATLT